MKLIKQLNYIFSKRQKVQLLGLSVVMLIGSFLELIGVAAIMPFVQIISNTEIIHSNALYAGLFNTFKFGNDTQFIVAFGVALIALYISKNVYVIFMNHLQYRFTFNNQQKITEIMMECYMRQPYTFHINQNISELHRNVKEDVAMMFGAVLAIIQMISEITVSGLLLLYLLYIDKFITLSVMAMLLIFAIFFLKVVRKKATTLGSMHRGVIADFNKWIRQGFEGIKEIKIVNREQFYVDNISKYGTRSAKIDTKIQTINATPRPLFEAACISTLLAVVVVKIYNGANLEYFIPVLSAFAVAAARLLPSAGRVTSFLTAIAYNKASINNVYNDLMEIDKMKGEETVLSIKTSVIPFTKDIALKDVSFSYPSSSENVVENINITIEKNKSIAFIGPSGAGKTTVADIVLGLLKPQKGSVYSDGVDVYDNLPEWHKLLGYIPQTIYLTDDTIRNNILFGIPEKDADDEKVLKAIEDAQLTEFINSLENGIDTVVGERGVRLSGGQRQRIGIARALYNNPQILILDEATSALDNETETAVMEAIDALHGSRTMIIIAHRLSTIRNCDCIYEIKDKAVRICEKEEIFA